MIFRLFLVCFCSPDVLIEKASILFGIDIDDTKLKKMKELLQIILEHRHIVSKILSLRKKYLFSNRLLHVSLTYVNNMFNAIHSLP